MIAIELNVKFNRGKTTKYGANCQCEIQQATIYEVGSAIMSMIDQTCEAMKENAREVDMIGIDNKVFMLSVKNERRVAALEMTVRRTDNWENASNAVVDWILGDAVGEVVR